MWVLGGNANPGGLSNDVWFSTDGGSWNKMVSAAGWTGRSNIGAVTFNSKIYIIAGYIGGAPAASNEVWHSSDGITWTMDTAAAFTVGQYGMGCLVYNGLMWSICGHDNNVSDLAKVWSSPDGATWTLVAAAFG